MNKEQLADTAKKLVTPGKGILAADESTGTIGKRFESIELDSTEDSRRDWREMLFRADDAMSEYISGVILYDETLRQKAKDGTPIPELLAVSGVIPGIKVDTGAKELAAFEGEKITEGLDGLRDRLKEYYELGARFAKWRAVIEIDSDSRPHQAVIQANCHALARYAALCQEANIVPIVEPEVLMDGDHTIERCHQVTGRVLRRLYEELFMARVYLEGTVLKPNMVVPGKDCSDKASVSEVAERTVNTLKRTVPAAVPGIAFLSGGQSDEEATAHLDAMNRMSNLPWKLTFSYGRALQAAPLKAWNGSNVEAGQAAFRHRAKMNGLASLGQWEKGFERAA